MNRRRYNCPNCSAPIGVSPVCEYCGTRLEWLPIIKFGSEQMDTVDLGKTFFILDDIPEAEFIDNAKEQFIQDAIKDLKNAIWTQTIPKGHTQLFDSKMIQMRLTAVRRANEDSDK